jgi:hypothetical protein
MMSPACLLVSALLVSSTADPADSPSVPISAVVADVQDLMTNGPPDGVGGTYSFGRPVKGTNDQLSMATGFFSATLPVWTAPTDAVFAGASVSSMSVRTQALLPTDHVKFPSQWWDPEVYAAYVHDFGCGQMVGLYFGVGSPSDQPFHSISEINFTAMAFYRMPAGQDADWLFFLASSHAGQLGHYLPLPGFAYEFHSEQFHGAIGLPTSRLVWTPTPWLEWENTYSLLTDVRSRLTAKPTECLRLFTGFAWENQSWFRADRKHNWDQFFYYQKKAEVGVGWDVANHIRFEANSGWAFDRYFTETNSWSLSGRNRLNIESGPFVGLQAIICY